LSCTIQNTFDIFQVQGMYHQSQGCAMYPSVCPIPVVALLLRYRACTTYRQTRVVHGGGGGIRTRVPKHQIKSFYMFILFFYLAGGTSTGGIPDGQPLKISSRPPRANKWRDYPVSDAFPIPQAQTGRRAALLESSACQRSNSFDYLHSRKKLIN